VELKAFIFYIIFPMDDCYDCFPISSFHDFHDFCSFSWRGAFFLYILVCHLVINEFCYLTS
jgi:hypothetical protein